MADKVDDHAPLFSETMQFDAPYSFGLPAVDVEQGGEPPVAEPVPPEVPIADGPVGDADSEDGDRDPKDKYARLLQEAASVEHKRLHIPKNPHVKFVKGVVCTVGGQTQRDMIRLSREDAS